MKLAITHITRYHYDTPVSENVNEVRLTPRTNYRQSCYHHVLTVDPAVSLLHYEDFFGNKVYAFSVIASHRELVIKAQSTVVTQEQEPKSGNVLTLDKEYAILNSAKFQNRYAEFLLGTDSVQLSPAVKEFAGMIYESKPESIYETVQAISLAIYNGFSYSPGCTDVSTTVDELLKLRQGVCQDYTNLMLAVCRTLGIPARYVSGYHFVQDLQCVTANFVQASHAWVEAYIPAIGWLGFDPTNNNTMSWRYVKLGHGRDYNDIVPVKGVFRGGPGQRMEIQVDVKKIDEEKDDY